MWQIYALMAQDMARERRREAQANQLARDAAAFEASERRAHPALAMGLARTPARRAGRARRALAASLRRVSAGAASIARSACDAAARLDGQVA